MNGPSGSGRVTRRSLIKGAGGIAGASVAEALAGCENTTEAVAVSSGTPAGGRVAQQPLAPGRRPAADGNRLGRVLAARQRLGDARPEGNAAGSLDQGAAGDTAGS